MVTQQPIPPAVGGGGHADDGVVDETVGPAAGLRRIDTPARAVERGVPEGEDAAIVVGQPIPPAVGGGGHADDAVVDETVGPAAGLRRIDTPARAVERGVPEGEDAAVVGDEPVAAAVGGGGHADDGVVDETV